MRIYAPDELDKLSYELYSAYFLLLQVFVHVRLSVEDESTTRSLAFGDMFFHCRGMHGTHIYTLNSDLMKSLTHSACFVDLLSPTMGEIFDDRRIGPQEILNNFLVTALSVCKSFTASERRPESSESSYIMVFPES